MTTLVDLPIRESTHPPQIPDLDGLRVEFMELAAQVDEVSTGPVLVDRMTALATLRNSVDAALAATELSFARRHAADQTADGHVDPEQLERSIGAQIGLAHRASPTVGRNRMHTARDLHDGLDHVRDRHAVSGDGLWCRSVDDLTCRWPGRDHDTAAGTADRVLSLSR